MNFVVVWRDTDFVDDRLRVAGSTTRVIARKSEMDETDSLLISVQRQNQFISMEERLAENALVPNAYRTYAFGGKGGVVVRP